MKTVYFLGAGASKASDFHLPTMEGFFDEQHLCEKRYAALANYVQQFFPALAMAKLNLEDVITQLELSLTGFAELSGAGSPEATDARGEFDEYVRARLTTPDGACSKHRRLLGGLGDMDSVLTLNYDLVVDHTLCELGPKDPQTQELRPCALLRRSEALLDPHPNMLWRGSRASEPSSYRGRGYYLKLHGSLNYLYCRNRACANHQAFFVNWLDVGKEVADERASACNICGSALAAVIIPPAMGKSFDVFPKMGFVWNLAYRRLRDAERWILIGMSLPPSDYYLRWLLREAGLRRGSPPAVTVVNPCDAAEERVKRLLGLQCVERLESLDHFIERAIAKHA